MGEVNSVELTSEETGPDPPQPEAVEAESGGVPDKFKNEDGSVNTEALLSSYQELEKNYHGGTNADEEETPTEEAEPEVAEVAEEVEAANSAIDTYSQEFFDTGELKEESYAALENLGYPKDLVDSFINGQKAVINQEQGKIYEEVGGTEAYEQMSAWASVNMTDAAKVAYNSAVQSGNMDQAILAVRGLRDTYHSAEGIRPNLLQGRTSSASANKEFRSTAELVKAMRDPRYKEDSAYRQDIENRLKASSILGS
tara:strand:- start:57 stop:821 length:765 start_codon:yes stop_codon:yes gene_type:complete